MMSWKNGKKQIYTKKEKKKEKKKNKEENLVDRGNGTMYVDIKIFFHALERIFQLIVVSKSRWYSK